MVESAPNLSLVIACFNEECELLDSVRQIVDVLDLSRLSYEVIFVDDCSQDRTRELIDQLLIDYPSKNFRKLFQSRNMGRGRTVADGFRLARGEFVGYIDIDLEVHARYIPSMVLALQQGVDVATAHRIYKVQWRLFHRFVLSRGYSWLVRLLLKIDLKDSETGFKFFRRDRVVPLLDQVQDEHWFWDTEIMARSLLRGYQVQEIPCLFVRRYDKQSTVNVVRDSIEYFRRLWRFSGELRRMRAAPELTLS